jgi:hypothetical protein
MGRMRALRRRLRADAAAHIPIRVREGLPDAGNPVYWSPRGSAGLDQTPWVSRHGLRYRSDEVISDAQAGKKFGTEGRDGHSG